MIRNMESPDDSPFRNITSWGAGIVAALAEGIRVNTPAARRAAWRIEEVIAEQRAQFAVAHADRFCALPWYQRWWEMVRGR